MTISKALMLSMLLSSGAFGILGGHREVSDSDEDLEDIKLMRDGGNEGGSGDDRGGHHKHHAHSFQHFHGPVSGHHQEVSWKDKHGHHHHDFKAHPDYKFHYGVEDHHTKDFHGQKEHRDDFCPIEKCSQFSPNLTWCQPLRSYYVKFLSYLVYPLGYIFVVPKLSYPPKCLHCPGKELHGEYHIHEPGGNVRTVKYFSDHHGGFFAEVHNHGGNDHSGGSYGKH